MMEMTMNPSDALAAVTHADPYPYYTELAAQDGLVFDPALGLWIAASAASVAAVLTHAACRVRPLSEPVPAALAGTPAGQIFGDLIRMNEAPRHTQPRLALQRALTAVDLSAARQRAGDIASRAWRDDGLAAWMFEVPVATMASLIGFSEQQLPALTAWMADFVACLSPLTLSHGGQIERAQEAAARLLDSFKSLLQVTPAQRRPGSLLALVCSEAQIVGWNNADALLANLVGLLSQTYEATAGLIGNSIVALMREPEEERAQSPDAAVLVQMVSRFDPPVHNTRRYTSQTARFGDVHVPAGQTILVLLAAANRDRQAAGRVFGFGYGPHTCPGHALACAIAAGALERLLMLAPIWQRGLSWTYRPSLNVRMPAFTQTLDAA